MLSLLARILLTFSAIAPVSLTYAWVAWWQAEKTIAVVCLCLGIALVGACLVVLEYAKRHLEALPLKAQTIEPADAESFGFMLLYILPLFTDRIGALNWELWIPIVVVFAIITGTGYGYHFNPLLGILRWHFYKITSTDGVSYVLITKKHLRSASRVSSVGQLTEYILLDLSP